MSETRQILILTYVMTGIMVLQFFHSAAFRSFANALLSFVGIVIHRIRAKRTRPPRD